MAKQFKASLFSAVEKHCGGVESSTKIIVISLSKAHEKTVGMVFKAWRTWLVSTRLERFMTERENLQMNLKNLKHSLFDAKDTNKTMNENLAEQIKRRDTAEQKLKETFGSNSSAATPPRPWL